MNALPEFELLSKRARRTILPLIMKAIDDGSINNIRGVSKVTLKELKEFVLKYHPDLVCYNKKYDEFYKFGSS